MISERIRTRWQGDIHLGAASLLGKYLLPRILESFKKVYPNANLSMLVEKSKEILGFLENGMIEGVIVSERIPSRNLIAFPFYGDHLAIVNYGL
jgi:DNA-binding transcriptional LysR family regulator